VKRVPRDDNSRARFGGLQKAGLHFYGYAPAGARIQRTARHGHRYIEQGHEHAAMRNRPAIEVPRLEIERNDRPTIPSADELDTQLLDERDIESK
jgi:hypothetical protein